MVGAHSVSPSALEFIVSGGQERVMRTRRDFMILGAGGVLASVGLQAAPKLLAPSTLPYLATLPPKGSDRAYWVSMALRLATPVLKALERRELKKTMPVEALQGATDRASCTHLEALGRLLAGLAPWLELGEDESAEGRERARIAALAREAIDAGTDPKSADFMNFTTGGQPLVDAAFLAQAFLRAPQVLWGKLPPRVQGNVLAALKATRRIKAGESNWKLFASEIEVFLQCAGEAREEARLFEALEKFQGWYLGDGVYGDGAEFHWDYYNSFVIHPMLLDALEHVGEESPKWQLMRGKVRDRLGRQAVQQERLISPDGSYPILGRSLAYRCGAFQNLALAALRGLLPAQLKPGQVRCALSSVIQRTLEAPGTWDENGWLRVGVAGHQPSLGERYISTGSLYLCSVALLPLGLAPSDAFWDTPAEKTTWEKAWAGLDLPADHAL